MANIGIFRGKFDPIEKSSFEIAKELIVKMNVDVMVFVPAFQDEKSDTNITKRHHRANIVKLATSKHPKMAFDDVELNRRDEENETVIKTVHHFQRKYPGHYFYLFVDSNSLQEIDKWSHIEEIMTSTHMIIYPVSKNYIRDNASKFNITTVNLAVREAEGEYHKGRMEVVYPIIQDYIGTHYLYIENLLNSFLDIREHTLAMKTALFAKELALRNGADPKKAYIAGLLLWIGRGSNTNRKIKYLGMKGVDVTYMHEANYDGPFTAMWLKHEYKLKDEEILSAVYHHTFVEANMTMLDKIIYMAHKFMDKQYSHLVEVYKEDILYDFDYVWSTYMLALGVTYKKVGGKKIKRDPKTAEAIVEYAKGRYEEKRRLMKDIPGENRKVVAYVPIPEYEAAMQKEKDKKEAILKAVELEKQKMEEAARLAEENAIKEKEAAERAAAKEAKRQEKLKEQIKLDKEYAEQKEAQAKARAEKKAAKEAEAEKKNK